MAQKIVLMYHDIYDCDNKDSGFRTPTALLYKIKRDMFELQVKECRRLITIDEIQKIVFTFDDGGSSFLTIAAPILEEYDFRGEFFIATSYLGTDGFLSKSDVKELYRRGHIIGAHSHTHPERMSKLTIEQIREEWSRSIKELSEIIGAPITHASIPNGYFSKIICFTMEKLGLKNIYISNPTTKNITFRNVEIIGRYAIKSDMGIDDLVGILCNPIKRKMMLIRWNLLSLAKFILGPFYLFIRSKII